jgi:glycosyltransferase involved in cell wall biosynthesis
MKGSKPLYHLGQIWSGLRMTLSAARFNADVALISGGAHWFALGLMPLFGIKVVPTLHCVLWPKYKPPAGKTARIVSWLNGRFFRRRIAAAMSASQDITSQLRQLCGDGVASRAAPFLPSYREGSFQPDPPPRSGKPFRVLFAGRIEPNKGVFDLLSIARRFAAEGRKDIEFDVCGTGSALDALRRDAARDGLEETFRCHGHANRLLMRDMLSEANAVIVPTRTDFVEGFNQVVVEAVLAGRPVITSDVCPALAYVRQAAVEVPPDDVDAYARAILKLCDEPEFYASKRQACAVVARPFYDPASGWAAALKQVLAELKLTSAPV